MTRKRKHLLVWTIVFAVVLLAGFVYAALTGTLTFNGNVALGSDLELTIVPVTSTVSTPGGSTATMTLLDGQNARIDASLTQPGESVTLSFRVENTGALDALISGVVTTNANPQFVVSGDYGDLLGETVAVGAIVPLTYVDITVTWPSSGDPDTDAGDYSFKIELDYEVAP